MRLLALATLLFAWMASFTTMLHAEIQTKVVEYSDGELVLEGFLAWDDAHATEESPRPGVVVCPEWWGNNEYARSRATQLAKLGFVAFSIDLYGKGQITTDPKQATLWSSKVYENAARLRARARLGYDQLAAQPMVDRERMAVIGYCMGGTIALELARSGAALRAVVAFHAGKLTSLAGADKDAPIRASVTICHGQEDIFVGAEEISGFHTEMRARKVDYQFLSYAYAVHAFTNPGANAYKIPGVAYNAPADRRSWEHMQQAFREAFGS